MALRSVHCDLQGAVSGGEAVQRSAAGRRAAAAVSHHRPVGHRPPAPNQEAGNRAANGQVRQALHAHNKLATASPRLAGTAEADSEVQCPFGPCSARSSRMSMDRPRSRGVSFETPPQRVSTWPRLWPLLSSVAVGVIVFQVQSSVLL